MPTLEELHDAYMKSREIYDNYNFDEDNEARKLNEYFNSGSDIVDLHWQPVAKNDEPKQPNFIKISNKER